MSPSACFAYSKEYSLNLSAPRLAVDAEQGCFGCQCHAALTRQPWQIKPRLDNAMPHQ